MKITVLGSGTPTPSADRWGTSFALETEGHLALFDCGPGAITKLVAAGYGPTLVDWMFFTHHHYDHNVDLPTLLLSRWDQSIGGESELGIFGPAPTRLVTERLVGENGAFAHDILARINHPASQRVFQNRGGVLPRPWPNYQGTDLVAGESVDGPGFTVHSAAALHVQPYLDSLAYRVDASDGIVTFTGDTEPCDAVRELASGSDILFCMCCDSQEAMNRNGEYLAQCGTTGAADLAEAAGVKHLILVHSKAELAGPDRRYAAVLEVEKRFGNQVTLADEFLQVFLDNGASSATRRG